MQTANVVIVGGGIVGSAAAYFLCTDAAFGERRVVLIERDPSFTTSSTGRAVGGLRQQFSTPENIAMSLFTLAVLRRLKTIFGPDADVAFKEQGYLLLAAPEGRGQLEANVALQQSMEADIALLTVEELSQRFPWLATEGVEAAGYGLSGEGWFDPASLATLFRRAAAARGAVVVHDRVTGMDITGGRVQSVRLADGSAIHCEAVVNAAGAWAGDLAKLAGLALPVEPRKRYVYVVDCRDPPAKLQSAPLTVDISGTWFRPEGRFFLCGKSPDADKEPAPDDLDQIDYEFFDSDVWPQLAARVPAFESLKVINAWAGYYDYNSLDQNAVIGPHPEVANLYFANGFSGHGVQQAAAAGRAVAELIVHSQFKTIDLSRFGYTRIARGEPVPERNVI